MAQSTRTQAMMHRYGDAYIAARTMVGIGSVIKGIGIFLGAINVLVSVLAITSDTAALPFGIVGIVFGVFAGALLYICGVMVSAQGQILKASLDGAVNSSPFLTDDERADIMSLPNSTAIVEDGIHALDKIQF